MAYVASCYYLCYSDCKWSFPHQPWQYILRLLGLTGCYNMPCITIPDVWTLVRLPAAAFKAFKAIYAVLSCFSAVFMLVLSSVAFVHCHHEALTWAVFLAELSSASCLLPLRAPFRTTGETLNYSVKQLWNSRTPQLRHAWQWLNSLDFSVDLVTSTEAPAESLFTHGLDTPPSRPCGQRHAP